MFFENIPLNKNISKRYLGLVIVTYVWIAFIPELPVQLQVL